MKATEWKLGLSTCATNSLAEEVFRSYAENGIEVMEISLPGEMYPTINWKDTQRYARETGVEIRSLHLPFYPFENINIASADKSVREKTIVMQSELIERASEIGTHIAVIHPSGEPIPAEKRKDSLEYARESLSVLAENAARCGSTVAVENLPRTCLGNCISDMHFLLSGDSRLRICFDTNHLLNEKNEDFIQSLGGKFITIHVSDYDLIDEKHWLPYEGRNDWISIVGLLEQVGYSGPFLYEVGRKTPRTLTRRELTFADYRENYTACINKLPAKRIL